MYEVILRFHFWFRLTTAAAKLIQDKSNEVSAFLTFLSKVLFIYKYGEETFEQNFIYKTLQNPGGC